MATTDQMLRAVHAADKNTFNQRFTPQQLQAAFAKLKQGQAANPVTTNPVTTNPVTTNPVAADPVTASVGTKEALNTVGGAQEDLNKASTDIAKGIVNSGDFNQPFRFQADDAARQRIEDQVFARLTRGVGDKETQGKNELEASLANRGIVYSNDPNSRYQQEMRDFNNRFDTIRENARQDATAAGGQELERQFNLQSGAYNTALGGAESLSKLGLGGSVAFEQLSDADQERILRKWLARQGGRSSGGGSGGNDYGFSSTDPGGSNTGGL